MNKEVHHLMVFWVLFQTNVLTLWQPSPNQTHWRDGPGMATGSGKASRPVPSQVLPQQVEETDHFLGAPRKGVSGREA